MRERPLDRHSLRPPPTAPLERPGSLAERFAPLACGADALRSARKTDLLERLLVILIPVTLLCGAIQWWARPSAKLHFAIVVVAAMLAGMALVMNRMDCYRYAALLTCALPLVGSLASLVITPEEFIAFSYPAVGIILASMLLSSSSALAFAGLNAVTLLLLPLVQPEHSYAAVSAALGFNTFVPVLIVAGMKTRDSEELDRREDLKVSEERWRTLIESHPEPITISRAGRYLYVNDACMALYAATSDDDVIGHELAEFVHESCRGDLIERLRVVEAGGRVQPMPYRVTSLDGKERRVEASSVPMTYAGQTVVLTSMRNITEQWQAERDLKESEARFRAIVEHAPEAIVVIDLVSQLFVDCNTNAERMFGLDATAMAQGRPVVLSPPNQPDGTSSAQAWPEHVRSAMVGTVDAFEWSFLGAKGEVPCEVRLVQLPSQHGLFVRGSITDISAKKESEAALRVSEQRHRTLVETMNDGLIAVDLDLRITVVNDRFLEMFGVSRPVVGKRITDFADEAGKQELLRQTKLRRLGVSDPYEISTKRADGETILVRVTPSVITDHEGNDIGSFGVVRDITESKRLEGERQLVEAKIRSVVENATDVITVLDKEGRIVFESPSLERMLGYRPEDLKGRFVAEFIHEDDVTAVAQALRVGAANPGVPYQLEIRLAHIDGSWRTVETVGKVLPESLDDWQVVVHSRDITERRRLEQELLSVSNREQRRFGRDLHDGMGQVLVGARLYAAGLEKQLERRGAEEAAGAREIGRMLDEAHAQARALARGLSPVGLEDDGLISGLEDLADGLTRIYGVDCTVRATPTVHLDDLDIATHLYRIAQEAATNAARHAQPTRVEVSLEQRADTITLRVQDNGVGIEQERSISGGMGIPIMRRRAAMLNGSLEVSTDSDGTVVICTFPARRDKARVPTIPSFDA